MPEQFQCRFCLKSYIDVLRFLDHFETNMNDNKPNEREAQKDESGQLATQCKLCDKTFSNKSIHIKTVHDKVKFYKCDLCCKAFGHKGD